MRRAILERHALARDHLVPCAGGGFFSVHAVGCCDGRVDAGSCTLLLCLGGSSRGLQAQMRYVAAPGFSSRGSSDRRDPLIPRIVYGRVADGHPHVQARNVALIPPRPTSRRPRGSATRTLIFSRVASSTIASIACLTACEPLSRMGTSRTCRSTFSQRRFSTSRLRRGWLRVRARIPSYAPSTSASRRTA